MKHLRDFALNALLGGVLVLLPLYLATWVLVKAVQSAGSFVRPVAKVLPSSLPAENLLAVLLIVVLCFLVGAFVRTRAGGVVRERLEKAIFGRIPGYALFRTLTERVVGMADQTAWQPVLIGSLDDLVLAFIVEELADGRYAVFVPSVPTPLAGSVRILPRHKVHLLDVPFTTAITVISRWGSGSGELVAAMRPENVLPPVHA